MMDLIFKSGIPDLKIRSPSYINKISGTKRTPHRKHNARICPIKTTMQMLARDV